MAAKKQEVEKQELISLEDLNNLASLAKSADLKMIEDNRRIARASARRKELIKYFKGEDKVDTYLSPMYRPYFGNVMTITISGVTIRFPVDGSKQRIPQTFADEIESRRMNIDNMINRQKRGAEIKINEDVGSAGSLEIF